MVSNNTTVEKLTFYQKVNNGLILTPFLFIIVADWLEYEAKFWAGNLRVLGLLVMLLIVLFNRKTDKKLFLLTIIFIPILLYYILISFNIKAGLEDGFRYLTPIILLFYAYALRFKFSLIITGFLGFVIIGDLWQVVNYINVLRGVDQWFYMSTHTGFRYYHEISGVARANGLVAFHGVFGFINALGYFIAKQYYHGSKKKWILTLMVVSMFLSFSYKAIGFFMIVLFIESRYKVKILIGTALTLLLGLIVFPTRFFIFFADAWKRISYYIIEGDSARAESYFMMFKHTGFFGVGVGMFGGAASTKYLSPYYQEINFNWYQTTYLATTDTYYPHLFIELGLLGGLLYMTIILLPLLSGFKTPARKMLLIIYSLLLFDSLFSFALNNIAYIIYSLSFTYAIINYETSTSNR